VDESPDFVTARFFFKNTSERTAMQAQTSPRKPNTCPNLNQFNAKLVHLLKQNRRTLYVA
jgi:hypothetical protein